VCVCVCVCGWVGVCLCTPAATPHLPTPSCLFSVFAPCVSSLEARTTNAKKAARLSDTRARIAAAKGAATEVLQKTAALRQQATEAQQCIEGFDKAIAQVLSDKVSLQQRLVDTNAQTAQLPPAEAAYEAAQAGATQSKASSWTTAVFFYIYTFTTPPLFSLPL
jgi:septal ring factor EnvC (AmiA/AmiB activator)